MPNGDRGYRDIFNATSDALFIHEADGTVLDFNERAAAMYGLRHPPGERLTLGMLSLGEPPHGPAQAAEFVRRALAGQPQVFEWRSRRPDGTPFWIEVALRAGDVAGQRRLISSVRDVTERKEAEVALRTSEDRFRALAEVTTEGLMLHDGGVVLDANLAFARLIEAPSVEALVGRPGLEVIPLAPGSRERVRQHIVDQAEDAYDVELVLPSGGRRIAETRGRATVYRGRTARLVSMVDVTGRRQAEAASQLMARRLSLALTATADAVWEWNVVTGEAYYSPRWFEMLGYADRSLPMTTGAWKALVHPEDLAAVREPLQAVLDARDSRGYRVELRMRAADGSWRWILARGNVVEREAGGTPALLAGTNTDITERKQAEQERARLEESLRQAQKMESIGRLAGGLAHDFNNLLTTIGGNVSLALRDLAPGDPHRELLQEIERAGASAAELTRQLLAFSRQQVIAPRALDLNELVRRVEKLLRRLIGEHIQVQTALAADLGTVRFDAAQLEQVLVNLCVNARDAMPEGGKLTIETVNVSFDEEYCARHPGVKPGPAVMVAVSDSGQGMRPEVKARLFEPFFTTKARGEGTGLGLAMVHGAVAQNGGRIEVYSEPGQGTAFKIYLPRTGERVQPEAAPRAAPLPTGSEAILLVEDQPAVRTLAVRLLRRQGYQVHAFPGGRAALEAVATLTPRPDLLFTDVVMPDMNGKALAEQVRALVPGIRVLFTSGYTDNVVVHHGVLDAGVEFVAKPYSLSTLAVRVREVLDGSRAGG